MSLNNTSDRSKKLLFIAYYYPPSEAIGAVRAERLVRYLRLIGWRITVVSYCYGSDRDQTPDSDRIAIEGVLDGLAGWFPGRIGSKARKISDYLNRRFWFFWCRRVYSKLRSRGKEFDLILATGSPFIGFELARKLSRTTGIPFVVDYRDPWVRWGHSAKRERAILREAALCLAVSPSLVENLKAVAQPRMGVHLLTNGFDPCLDKRRVADDNHWELPDLDNTILYSGRLYPPDRIITPVLRAIKAINARRESRIEFLYCGPSEKYALDEVKAVGVSEICTVLPNQPRAKTLAMQARAMINCVICSVDIESNDSNRGIITGKIFDCVSLARAILIITPPGSDAFAMFHGRAGIECVPAKTDCIVEAIGRLMKARLNMNDYEQYSWSGLSLALDGMLTEVLKNNA